MRAGRIRHRVELKSSTAEKDGYGEETLTWSKYATIWADIQPFRASEIYNAQQVQAEITHKVTIRYNSSVDEKHRVVFGSRILEIVSLINAGERGIYQELLCKEVAS